MTRLDPIEPTYDASDEGVENYLAVKEEALKMLQGADGFVLFCGYVEGDGFRLKSTAGVRNIPAPLMLKEARLQLRKLERAAVRDYPDA